MVNDKFEPRKETTKMRNEWIVKIDQLKEIIKRELDFSTSEIIGIIGIEKFIEILNAMEKMPYYFSYKKLAPLMTHYVSQQMDSKSPSVLARDIGVDKRTIQKIVIEIEKKATREKAKKNTVQLRKIAD